MLFLSILLPSQVFWLLIANPNPIHPPNLLQALFLGFVQGVTEFLPISSTAHLKVVPVALGWGDPGVTFTAISQLGSIAAILWYFWSDLVDITQGSIQATLKGNYQSFEFRLGLGILLGTLPIVLAGLGIKVMIPNYDESFLRGLLTIAITSIALAILLGLAEKFGMRDRAFQNVTLSDSLWMGLAQALSVIPGVSRAGSTFTAGLVLGLEREATARLSFLLGIPAITLAGLAELPAALQTGWSQSELLPLVIGTLSSAFFSYLSIVWLLRFLQNRTMWIFVWYRIGFGSVILLSSLTSLFE